MGYHPMVGMSEADRMKYIDLHYLYINDDPTLELVGCYSDWPVGRGIFINDEKYHKEHGIFIVWVGEEDQYRIMAMNKGSDVQAVWDLFYAGVEAVHKAVKDMGGTRGEATNTDGCTRYDVSNKARLGS